MKALQIIEPKKVDVVDVPIPKLDDHDVLVEVDICQTCTHWDLTVWNGKDIFEREGFPKYPLNPGEPGHEIAGTVVDVGKEVTLHQIGDRVGYWWTPEYWTPEYLGGYAEYKNAHERLFMNYSRDSEGNLIKKHMSMEEISFTEMLTCVTSSIECFNDVRGKTIGVSGLGPAGLLAIQTLKNKGAKYVVGFDILYERIDLARRLGADESYLVGSVEWEEMTHEDNMLDMSMDCVGLSDSVMLLHKVTRGPILLFGIPHGNLFFSRNEWARGVTIIPSGYPTLQGAELARSLILHGKVNVVPMITSGLPITDYEKGIDLLEKKALKVSFKVKGSF